MCGLIYAHSFLGLAVNDYIFDQYTAQKHRGQQGFGLFNGLQLARSATEERIINWLSKNQSSLIMFHHRTPTSTINVKQAAHPFTTRDYFGKKDKNNILIGTEYILVHNGWIANAKNLFIKHQELGINYQSLLPDLTFNDSESLLWDFALWQEGRQDKLQASGPMAFMVAKLVDGEMTTLYFGRNYNPLRMEITTDGLTLSSEGKGAMIEANTLYAFDYATQLITGTPCEFRDYSYRPKQVKPIHNVAHEDWQDTYNWSNKKYQTKWARKAAKRARRAERLRQRDLLQEAKVIEAEAQERLSLDTAEEGTIGFKAPRGYNHAQSVAVGEVLDEAHYQFKPTNLPGRTVRASERSVTRQWLGQRLGHQETPQTSRQAKQLAMAYLLLNDGNYSQAYWQMNNDYIELEAIEDPTDSVKERMREIRQATLVIDGAAEYVDENSVSTAWKELTNVLER
jgi:hypothetical protein